MADEPEAFARLERDIDAIECSDGAEAFGDVIELDNGPRHVRGRIDHTRSPIGGEEEARCCPFGSRGGTDSNFSCVFVKNSTPVPPWPSPPRRRGAVKLLPGNDL